MNLLEDFFSCFLGDADNSRIALVLSRQDRYILNSEFLYAIIK